MAYKNRLATNIRIEGKLLKWDKAKGVVQLGSDFLNDLYQLKPYEEGHINENAVIGFMQKYGPLWNSEINIYRAIQEMQTFKLFYDLHKSCKIDTVKFDTVDKFFEVIDTTYDDWKATLGGNFIPFTDSLIDDPEQAIKVVMVTKALYQCEGKRVPPRRHKFFYWPSMFSPSGNLLPIQDTNKRYLYWPRFKPPKSIPEDKHQLRQWAYGQLLDNIKAYLQLHVITKVDVVTAGKGSKVDISHDYDNAMAWAFVQLLGGEFRKECPVCHKPVSNGTYCSRKCEKADMSTAGKQSILDYLGQQKRRHKLSVEQYEFAKGWICQLNNKKPIGKDVAAAKDAMAALVEALRKRWPDEGFAFLSGFGTRVKKNRDALKHPC